MGTAYWLIVARWSGVTEPWDAARYWSLAYPGALVLAAVFGWWRPRGAWLSGAIVVLAQVPVVVVASGAGPLLAAGLLVAAALSVPAMLVAGVAGRFRARGGR